LSLLQHRIKAMSTPWVILHVFILWNQNMFCSGFTITTTFTQTQHHQRTTHLHTSTTSSNEKKNDIQTPETTISETSNSPLLLSRLRAAVFQPLAPSNSIKSNPLGILTQAAACLRVASKSSIDLVLFPELYLTGGPYNTQNCNDGDGDDDDSEDGNAVACTSLDRESYDLSIIGNLCAELNVACAIGYAEKKHESEIALSTSTDKNDSSTASINIGKEADEYNSMALFHADDGTRAGNFRCTSAADKFLNGHPFAEVMPINLNLPSRVDESRSDLDCQIKVGMAVGNKIFVPEYCRHLARSGAQLLLASNAFHSLGESENDSSSAMHKKCVLTTRAIENGVPILTSNYVGTAGGMSYNGSSGIMSSQGEELVMAPETEGGDMPCDEGYLLPCETGDLYAADLCVIQGSNSDMIQSLLNAWDLSPHIMCESESRNDDTSTREKAKGGFGKEVERIVERNRKKKVRK
jgi:predicted amidohydrolase